jgi:Ca-activated chloride channel family protein
MKRTFFIVTALAVLLGAAALPGLADGVLIVEPPFPGRETKEPLSVKYHRVSVRITDQVATTRIDQVFINRYTADLEAEYIFPLPESAAISSFSLWIDGRKTSGEVLDSEKARKIYEDIVRRMKDPGLLEYVGRNMFKARVYPVPAGGETRIELEYTQTLRYDAGLVRYVYPLDTERFSPDPIGEVSISAEISSSVPIKTVYSPSHDIDLTAERYRAVCGFEDSHVRPDTDFVLYYTVSEKEIGANMLAYREEGEKGYFLLFLSPGEIDGPVMKKDIVFVIDTSGSMRGEKMQQAKQALLYCVDELNDGDRFCVIGFSTTVNPLKNALLPVNGDTKKKAAAFVDELSSRGGTNINEALKTAAGILTGRGRAANRPGIMVFLTDGEPTVGETDTKRILNSLESANRENARVFVFGVGEDVNTHLLDRISIAHRGISEYVGPDEDISHIVSSFYDKIAHPVLSDIGLDFGKIRISEIYPFDLPDLFKGSGLLLLGRYEGKGSHAIVLEGAVERMRRTFTYEASFPEEETKNDFIPRLWAMRKIGYLMSEIRLHGENAELVDEIVRLSKEHGIMTPYTSYLVLESSLEGKDDYDRFGIPETEAELIRDRGEEYKTAMRKETGAGSVARATDINRLKQSSVSDDRSPETVRHMGKKTFYLTNEGWIDSDYETGMKTVEIRAFSKRYFELFETKPGIGRYLSLALNITIAYEGTCYRITE